MYHFAVWIIKVDFRSVEDDFPISFGALWVSMFVQLLALTDYFGGVLHADVIGMKPEFAFADVVHPDE